MLPASRNPYLPDGSILILPIEPFGNAWPSESSWPNGSNTLSAKQYFVSRVSDEIVKSSGFRKPYGVVTVIFLAEPQVMVVPAR